MLIWIGMAVGSTVGGFVPALWGAGFLSMSGFLFSGLGALFGIWLGVKARELI
jgi:predicted MFS family arabinose efflux permease